MRESSKKKLQKNSATKVAKPRINKKTPKPLATKTAQVSSDGENERPTHYYLIKSEPESRLENGVEMKFSLEDLKNRKDQIEHWDGVRNYQARNTLKSMRLNDLAFFYHSNCKHPAIVGVVKIVKEFYPDHTQFDKTNPHYDSKSDLDNPKWGMVDVQFLRELKRPITLSELRSPNQSPLIKSLPLLGRARLSCQALTTEQWDAVMALESQQSDEK